MKDIELNKCCICGKMFKGFGNDPWPVVTDPNAKCCDGCNLSTVITARLANLRKVRKDNSEQH